MKRKRMKLMDAYTDLNSNLAYSAAVSQLAKKFKMTESEVKRKMRGVRSWTLHRQARKQYPTRKYLTMGMDHQWQIDLVEMQKFKSQNSGVRYMLSCIDIFSRYAWVEPVKDKTGPSMTQAMAAILKRASPRRPYFIQSDQGKEFYNSHFQNLMKAQNIHHFSVTSQFKAAFAERFNRTLKGRMYRYFTHNNTFKWLDVVQKLVDGYNRTQHRSIGMAPVEVNEQNEMALWQKLYGKKLMSRPYFKIDDYVRVSKHKHWSSRGFLPQWSEEVFQINRISKGRPVMYELRDYQDTVIDGKFYREELQRVDKPEFYVVEKVLQTKGNQKLIKWLGYKHPTWIDSKLIK